MRRAVMFVWVSLMTFASAATAQISVIVVPKEPQEAQALAARCEKVVKVVNKVRQKGALAVPARRKIALAARKFMTEARRINRSSQVGIPLSYLEEASIKKDLKKVQTICRWLAKQATGAPDAAAATALLAPGRNQGTSD